MSDILDDLSILDASDRIRAAVKKAGWAELMPVQAKTIPYLLSGRDLMVQSRTGSGKTAAFVLPLLDKLKVDQAACQALVLVPTRELARQVADEAEMLGSTAGLKTAAVYGGVKFGPQVTALEGGAQIVVGTPGRILDHLLRGTMKLNRLTHLIFDEADRMLSMGFYPDMKQVQRYLPDRRINSCMFSATYPPHVISLSRQFLIDAEFLSLSHDSVHVAEVEHVFYTVPGMEKDRCLIRIIEMENPVSAIIFCNTKSQVHYVSVVLQRFGYDADELSADLTQAARERVLKKIKGGKLRFLVATDVAARGIDIPELSHIFQFEPPEDVEVYIHRAGRTGRAGAGGVAISLVAGMEVSSLGRIAKRFGIDMLERPLPTESEVVTIVSQRLIALLEAKLRSQDLLHTERMQRFIWLAGELAQTEEESPIIAMLLDDYYQQALHPTPEVPSAPPERQPQRPDRSRSSSDPRKRSDSPRRRR